MKVLYGRGQCRRAAIAGRVSDSVAQQVLLRMCRGSAFGARLMSLPARPLRILAPDAHGKQFRIMTATDDWVVTDSPSGAAGVRWRRNDATRCE